MAQTFSDFELTISDAGSTDGTREILREYADRDPRIIVLHQNGFGMVENFRAAFQEARGKYFMWAADHDLWESNFLEAHVEVMEAHPSVVLAYPLVAGIDADGQEFLRDPRKFQTFGMAKRDRIREASIRMVGAGNMVYGLFRTKNLRKTSVYPMIMMPDRVLLMELAIQGEYFQIDRYLWYRRYPEGSANISGVPPNYEEIIERQRSRIFVNRKAPWLTMFPTLAIALKLIANISILPKTGTYANAYYGPYMAFLFIRRRRHNAKAELRIFARKILKRRRRSASL